MLLGKVLECVVTTDIGGQLSYASLIENYPGFDAAPGINLVEDSAASCVLWY
jgi:thioredoxin reductase